jgi:hypothetical protein
VPARLISSTASRAAADQNDSIRRKKDFEKKPSFFFFFSSSLGEEIPTQLPKKLTRFALLAALCVAARQRKQAAQIDVVVLPPRRRRRERPQRRLRARRRQQQQQQQRLHRLQYRRLRCGCRVSKRRGGGVLSIDRASDRRRRVFRETQHRLQAQTILKKKQLTLSSLKQSKPCIVLQLQLHDAHCICINYQLHSDIRTPNENQQV